MSAVTPAWVKTLLSMVQFENGTFPTIALPGAAGLLASVLIPLALAFFGYRFMKAFISLTGFSAGAVIGYLIGIVRKVLQLVVLDSGGFIFFLGFFFYVLNACMIFIDMMLWFRNRKLDAERDAKENG